MNTEVISLIIFGCVVGAVLIGRAVSRLLPAEHLRADTKETVKLAIGLLATMSALLLGLLVTSAKASYDNARNDVIQMAAKVVFLDRVR
jgi:spore maturation protein SpmA